MSTKTLQRTGLAAAVAFLSFAAPVLPAQAQSAAQINQMSQAIQACNAMGALAPPECAQLRGQAMSVVGGMGGKAGQAASIAGALMGAFGNRAAAAAPSAPTPAGAQAAYAACIQSAGLNTHALQACSSQLQASVGNSGLPTVDRNTAAALGSYGAAGAYQACVAANPTNWQMCVQQMGAASTAGLAAAGVTPQQMQAAGVPAPQAAAPADPFASVFGGR